MTSYPRLIELIAVCGIFLIGLLEVLKSMGSRSIQGRMMGFVEDLFDEKSPLEISELMEKWKVSQHEFSYWLRDKRFLKEIKIKLKWKAQTGQIFIARYAVSAAARLVQLTDSRNTETSRRACVDILNLLKPRQPPGRPPGRPARPPIPPEHETIPLTEEVASSILDQLARRPEQVR